MKKLIDLGLAVFCFIFLTVGLSFAEHSYKGRVVALYDADTFTVEYDLGFNLKLTESSRLIGLDTPELRTKNEKEKALGYKAKAFVEELILGKEFNMIVYKRDKYGRPLVEVFLPDGKTLSQTLIEKGFAYAYDGGTKRGWDNL